MTEKNVRTARTPSGPNAGRLQTRKTRHDGWTIARRARFIEHLAISANVTASAKKAGISTYSAYQLRHRCAVFAAQWEEALDIGYDKLQMALLQRATNGVAKPLTIAGVRVDATVYTDDQALRLLTMHRATVEARRARRADDGSENARFEDGGMLMME